MNQEGRRPDARRDRGAVIPIVAIVLPVLLVLTAFAVDLGRQRSSRRTMQARADVIALDMVRLADGRTEQQILADPGYAAYLDGSASRNEVERDKLTVAYGTVTEILDASGKVTGLGPFIETLATGIPNAVKVTATETTDYFFRPGTGDVTRTAIATTARTAGFQIGSKLLTVDTTQANLLNGLLNGALNTNLALDAATYNGLVGAGVHLGQLATALGVGNPEELADATIGAADLMLTSAQILEQQGQTAAANVLNLIAAQTDEDAVVDMGQLLSVAAGGGREAAVEAGFDVFNLLVGSAFAVNGSETLAIPGLGVNLPAGLLNTGVSVNVIERPRAVFGPVGTSITTQQASVKLGNKLSTDGLTLGLVNVTGTIDVTTSVAGATGTLTGIECGTVPGISVGVAPQPVSVSVKLDLSIRALGLLGLPGIEVARVTTTLAAQPNGSSNGGSFDYPVEFMPPVGQGEMITAPAAPLGLADLLEIENTNVEVLGILPLPLGGLVSSLNNTILNPLLSTLDPLITGPISNALGLQLGGADIGALNMTCNNVKLVG